MLLKVTHQTTLHYSDLITETIMEMRVAPRQSEDQLRLAFTLGVGPPAAVSSYFDWLGNLVHIFNITPFHKEVLIVASSVVETHRTPPNLMALEDTWPLPRLDYVNYDYLRFGGAVADCPELTEMITQLHLVEGQPLGSLALQILGFIHSHFTYEKGVTTATSPIQDVLRLKRGVCQDFTHLMIAVARKLGIPARYVSGIIHSGDNVLRGAAQTHAWCEFLFPSLGWIGFDPTNNALADDRFVSVAMGRDYHDVPPNRGVYRGKAKESIKVEVTTEVLSAMPQHLTGERVQTLRVATYPHGRDLSMRQMRKLEGQQQQQQQEQQQQ